MGIWLVVCGQGYTLGRSDGVDIVSVLVFGVVCLVVDVSVMMIIMDVMGCLGFEGVHGGSCFFCLGGLFSLYLAVGQHCLLMQLTFFQQCLIGGGKVLLTYTPFDKEISTLQLSS